jgi:hypothetical protein
MTKENILALYRAAKHHERREITGAALEYLTQRGHPVTRQALKYWRENETPRSPLAPLYLKAYRKAIQSTLQPCYTQD